MHHHRPVNCIWHHLILSITLLVAISLGISPLSAAESDPESYDHETTTLPTMGAHAALECEACHPEYEFENTPTECAGCHDGKLALEFLDTPGQEPGHGFRSRCHRLPP